MRLDELLDASIQEKEKNSLIIIFFKFLDEEILSYFSLETFEFSCRHVRALHWSFQSNHFPFWHVG